MEKNRYHINRILEDNGIYDYPDDYIEESSVEDLFEMTSSVIIDIENFNYHKYKTLILLFCR